MEKAKKIGATSLSEINIQSFIKKILEKKFWYVLSIVLCVAAAYAYIKTVTPKYEVSTTLLIDQGDSRKLGESQSMGGEVSLIETEKNLYNEIGIIKSYNLIEQTVRELDFEVSYHSANWYQEREHYGYFPVEVELIDSSAQAYGMKFYFEFLSDSTYRLMAQAKEFTVSNPATGTNRQIESEFEYSNTYAFGEEVVHDYFNFIVRKPDYKVVMDNFEDMDKLYFEFHSIEGLTSQYMGKLNVTRTDIQASILKLVTQGAVPDKEIDFLQKLSANYIANKLAERDNIAISKESFIRKQLAMVSDSLARAERRVEAFRRSSQLVNISQTASSSLSKIQTLQSDRSKIDLNIKYYYSLLQSLNSNDDIGSVTVPSMVGIDDPLLNENLMELKRLYAEKTRQEYIKGKKSLDLEILNQQIANAKNAIKENLKSLIQSSEMALGNLNGQIDNIEGVINQLPTDEKRLVDYERKSSLYENLYKYLSQELAKTGIAKAEDIADTRVLNAARMVGSGPVSPQKKLIILLAAIIGLIFPTAYIVLFESFDDPIRDLNHLDSITTIPIVASVARDTSGSGFFSSDLSEWRVEESFRDLSANLQFLMPDGQRNVIGTTSTVPNEGKTFVAVNLAINLAKSGKKVLLVDTDLRNPSLPIDDDMQGLSDYLRDEKLFYNQIIHKHKTMTTLHYVPTHVVEDNPHELLLNPRFETLISDLRGSYDFIVVDAPAIGVVSDYLLILKHIDVHLFVVRRKTSKRSFIRDVEKWKKKGKVENLYIVLNDVVGRAFKYGQSYRYGESTKKSSVEKYFTS